MSNSHVDNPQKNKVRIWLTNLWVCFANRYIEFHNTRLENKKRRWVAVGRLGGRVPLGKVSQDEAITKASQFGSIIYVDTEVAVVMYSDKS